MKQIKSQDSLIGKIITRIDYLDFGETLILFFENEYAVYSCGDNFGENAIEFCADKLKNHQLLTLGIITEEQYAPSPQS